MEGMSQSAARRQLRKRPFFTFLLKEIVGTLVQRAWERSREHAEWSPLSPTHQPVFRAGRWGIAGSESVH